MKQQMITYGNSTLDRNEREANYLVAKVMRITFYIFTLIFIANLTGFFVVDKSIMLIAYLAGSFFVLLPTVFVSILKNEGRWVKYLNVTCASIMLFILVLTLTYHTYVFFVFAIAISSLYFSKKLSRYAMILSVALVSLAQFISFKLQTLPDDNQTTLYRLIVYGIIPRGLVLIALSTIFTILCKRTTDMLGSLMDADEQARVLKHLEQMKEKSSEVSGSLSSMVSELTSIAGSSSEANQNIAQETGEILQRTSQNASNVLSANEQMQFISNQVINMKNMSNEITELAKQVQEATMINEKTMDQAAESMSRIHESSLTCKELIQKLGQESEEIIGIVKVISGISSKTNILALNASIEAARAGEQGKGFTVVAKEIQQLAEQTNSAVESIGNIIRGVVESTGEAVRAIEDSAKLTTSGLKDIHVAKDHSNTITEANKKMTEKIEFMDHISGRLRENGIKIKNQLNDINENIQSNLSGVEQMTAATEENSASIENISEMIQQIEEITYELNDIITYGKV